MPSVTDALARFVNEFDLAAMAEALGDELSAEVLATSHYADQIVLDRAGLATVLGAAASRGVARFISVAALEARDDDPTAAVLAAVRTALDLICTPADSAPQAERAERATRGVHLLLQLVNR